MTSPRRTYGGRVALSRFVLTISGGPLDSRVRQATVDRREAMCIRRHHAERPVLAATDEPGRETEAALADPA